MKLSESVLNQVLDGLEFELGERVPFFKCTSDSVIVLNEEEYLIVDTFYTEELDNQLYVKMGSTSMTNDKFDGAEPMTNYNGSSYIQTNQAIWQEQLGEAISANEMINIRKVAYKMSTLDGAKELAIEEIEAYFDELGAQGFMSDCLGESKLFDSDSKSVSQIAGQVTTAQQNLINYLLGIDENTEVSWKEHGVELCYAFTTEQMIKLGSDLQKAITELEHNRELMLQAINSCETIEQVTMTMASLS